MTASKIRAKIVAERVAWIRKMIEGLEALPHADFASFQDDPRTVAAAESYCRRALEALLDLGRHILAKGFGRAVVEYKDIASSLQESGVLDNTECRLLRDMAGYRNRMVHFYHEISPRELFEIRTTGLQDIERILKAMLHWINAHPDRVDST